MKAQFAENETGLQSKFRASFEINLGYLNLDHNLPEYQDPYEMADWYSGESSLRSSHPCNFALLSRNKVFKFNNSVVGIGERSFTILFALFRGKRESVVKPHKSINLSKDIGEMHKFSRSNLSYTLETAEQKTFRKIEEFIRHSAVTEPHFANFI